jgi:hypothetical protein
MNGPYGDERMRAFRSPQSLVSGDSVASLFFLMGLVMASGPSDVQTSGAILGGCVAAVSACAALALFTSRLIVTKRWRVALEVAGIGVCIAMSGAACLVVSGISTFAQLLADIHGRVGAKKTLKDLGINLFMMTFTGYAGKVMGGLLTSDSKAAAEEAFSFFKGWTRSPRIIFDGWVNSAKHHGLDVKFTGGSDV